jgi:hypothetical protein
VSRSDLYDDSLNTSWSDWRDQDREVTARTKRRVVLTGRGTLRIQFDRTAPTTEPACTAAALDVLRSKGLL